MMETDQISLPGFDDGLRANSPHLNHGNAVGYTLFFAIFPNERDAIGIAKAASALRYDHGLTGKLTSPERLHISLHDVISFQDTERQLVIDAAVMAAKKVVSPPIPIVFNRVARFPTGRGFMLLGDADTATAFAQLQKPLGLALRGANLRIKASGKPHLTMMYETSVEVPEHAIAPIRWTANRFALVISHVGSSHYEWIGEWPLANGNA